MAACSRTQQDWRIAQQAGTADAYKVFAERHPDSELAGVARQRMTQLTEEVAWQQAIRVNTAAAYQEYLARYPNGSWSQDARIRMESRSMTAQAPQDALTAMAAGGERVSTPGAPVVQAHDAAANPGRSAVQLGAFSSVANADSAWTQLSSRFRPELQGLTPRIVPVMSSGRSLYRLEARVADQAAARRLCRQLQQQSQGCLPVP